MTRSGLAILVNSDDPFNAKTAAGVLRYGRDPITALVDPERASRSASMLGNFLHRRRTPSLGTHLLFTRTLHEEMTVYLNHDGMPER